MEPYVPPQKIVIVEDNISLADIYKTRLEMIGYRCFVAYDGEQALSAIQLEKPNLVLLDLMVPKIAGDQILARMRASDWGKDIKVYIISNLNEADAPAGIRDYGIEGYTVKANLSNDAIDKLVDDILKPKDQKESVSLESKSPEKYGEESHFDPRQNDLPPMPPPPPDPKTLEQHSPQSPPQPLPIADVAPVKQPEAQSTKPPVPIIKHDHHEPPTVGPQEHHKLLTN